MVMMVEIRMDTKEYLDSGREVNVNTWTGTKMADMTRLVRN